MAVHGGRVVHEAALHDSHRAHRRTLRSRGRPALRGDVLVWISFCAPLVRIACRSAEEQKERP